MNLNVIRLNKSQEKCLFEGLEGFLKKNGSPLLENPNPVFLETESGLALQKISGAVVLRPVLIPLPADFLKEEFLGVESLELSFSMPGNAENKKGAVLCLDAKIRSKARLLSSAAPFAFFYDKKKGFSLEDIFLCARPKESGGFLTDKKFSFFPSSFAFARAEIFKNQWFLYNEAWKKLAPPAQKFPAPNGPLL